jgi:hypothetical protein
MATHRIDWVDCWVWPGGQCVAPVHDWCILVEVWDQEFTAPVSVSTLFLRLCIITLIPYRCRLVVMMSLMTVLWAVVPKVPRRAD